MIKCIKSFTLFEKLLWVFSVTVIITSAVIFGSSEPVSVGASLIGVTSLIFIAKGHYIGQALTIVFSVLYGIISVKQCYYGEAFTYLGMTVPSALFTMIVWIRHPYQNSDTVEVSSLTKTKIAVIVFLPSLLPFYSTIFCLL